MTTLAALAACATIAGIDGLEIGECKGGACGPGDSAVDGPEEEIDGGEGEDGGSSFDASALPCAASHGPLMVRVGTETNNFCIDSTEVTVAQYREFVVAMGSKTAGQPTVCAWNTSFQAGFTGADDTPAAGVDWCDARAYCAWAGKRLCGKRSGGKFVGPVGVDDLGDFNTHEWLLVCTNVGQVRYPYGNTTQGTTCNTVENDAGHTVPVGSMSGCEGGFPGVFDMLGNVWEWIDGPCFAPDGGSDGGPAKQECYVKGGAFLNGSPNLDCRVDGLGATRDRRGLEIGFRCCAE